MSSLKNKKIIDLEIGDIIRTPEDSYYIVERINVHNMVRHYGVKFKAIKYSKDQSNEFIAYSEIHCDRWKREFIGNIKDKPFLAALIGD